MLKKIYKRSKLILLCMYHYKPAPRGEYVVREEGCVWAAHDIHYDIHVCCFILRVFVTAKTKPPPRAVAGYRYRRALSIHGRRNRRRRDARSPLPDPAEVHGVVVGPVVRVRELAVRVALHHRERHALLLGHVHRIRQLRVVPRNLLAQAGKVFQKRSTSLACAPAPRASAGA